MILSPQSGRRVHHPLLCIRGTKEHEQTKTNLLEQLNSFPVPDHVTRLNFPWKGVRQYGSTVLFS